MVIHRTFILVSLACLALGCASLEAPKEDTESWKSTWKNRASKVAEGTATGAKVVGESLSVAAHGVAKGFDDPDEQAFGAYPKRYPNIIQNHLVRFEGIPSKASLRFSRPVKGYMNRGLFLGGGVSWQGYLVDVHVQVPSRFEGQDKELAYTVRLRDGEVIEVHDSRYTAALRRVEPEAAAEADGDPRKMAATQ